MTNIEDLLGDAGDPARETGDIADTLAASIAGDTAKNDPEIASRTAELLALQIKRLRSQERHFAEEHRLELSHLRWRRWSDLARATMEGALAFLVLAIVIGSSVLVWQASHAKGLVAEPFKTPPDFIGKGLDGTVLAQQVLDRLNRLVAQADLYDIRKPQSVAGSWSDDSKVQIPTTGISIAELSRLLRDWLGNETHVSGEVYRDGSGIALTIRVGQNPGTTFKGAESDLDHLLDQAARSLLKQFQVFSYVNLSLDWRNEEPDTMAVAKDVSENGPAQERAYGALAQSAILILKGDYRSALPPTDLAVQLAPRDVYPYYQRWDVDMALEHREAALFDGKMEADLLQANAASIRSDAAAEALPQCLGMLDELRGAYLDALPFLEKAGAQQFDTYDVAAPVAIATEFALDHDPKSANAILSSHPSLSDIFAITQFALLGIGELPHFEALAAVDDWAGAAADLERADRAILADPDLASLRHTIVWPRLAYAWARTGNQRGADALIAMTPLDCTPCLQMRGRIAELGGRPSAAARWFERTIEFSPSIPLAYADWGAMLLRRGDYDGAIAKFEQAHAEGPHYADPLEMWGEALMQKNRSDLALAKFEEANKYAPRWGRLHLEWGKALAYIGRKDDARAQVDAARSMDLSAADRAALARWEAATHA